MDRVEKDNRFFDSFFFPASTAPPKISYPIHKKVWTKVTEDAPIVGIILKVLLAYLVFRVVRRLLHCFIPGLFSGTCWVDVIANLFRCRGNNDCPRPRCPIGECTY